MYIKMKDLYFEWDHTCHNNTMNILYFSSGIWYCSDFFTRYQNKKL